MGFSQKNGLAGARGRDDLLGVLVGRGADADGVDVRVLAQLVVVVVWLAAVLQRAALGERARARRNPDQVRVPQPERDVVRMHLPRCARPPMIPDVPAASRPFPAPPPSSTPPARSRPCAGRARAALSALAWAARR